MITKLSIVVPVYNVEKYIRPCFESIFKQGLDDVDFEVIIVNDGSTDRSMEVIADIIRQHSNIIVINQENQGLSVARNNGIAMAHGEYILMLDSDDLLWGNSLMVLLNIALKTEADIINADYKQMNNEDIDLYLKKRDNEITPTPIVQIVTGEDFLYEQYCRNVWRYIYKREFILCNNLSFIPGIISQDVAFANECFLKANKCVKVNLPLIIYRWGNPSQATMYFTVKKAKDLCIAIQRIWSFIKLDTLATSSRKKQEDIVFAYFFRLINATTYGHIKKVSERLEIIDYMNKLVPDLCFKNNIKQMIWTLMYRNMPHSMIKMYGLLENIRKALRRN